MEAVTMAEQTIRYKNHEIVVDEEGPRLAVDGDEVDVNANKDRYWTPLRPYEEFLSLKGIAQTLIDDSGREVN